MALFSVLVDIAARTASLEEGVKRAEARIEGFGETVKKVAERSAEFFGIGLGVEALSGAVEKAISRGEELARVSERMHVAVESLSQLQYAAQATHVPFEALSTAFDTMEKNLGMATDGTGRAKKAIEALHLDAKKLLDLPFDQQLSIIADRFEKTVPPAKQTQIAMQLFGDAGTQLLPILQRGSEGIKQLRDESDRLGYTLTAEGAEKLKDAEEGMNRMKASTTALSTELTIALAPAISTVAGWLTKATEGVMGFLRATNVVDGGKLKEMADQLKVLQAERDRIADSLNKEPGLFEKFLNLPSAANHFHSVADNIKAGRQAAEKELDKLNAEIASKQKEISDLLETSKDTGNKNPDVSSVGLPELGIMKNWWRESLDKMTEFYNRLDDMTQTDTEKSIAEYGKKKAALQELYNSGIISLQEFSKRNAEALDKMLPEVQITGAQRMFPKVKKDIDQMTLYADQAARNMQSAFANFLFDPFKSGVRGMALEFINIVRRMIAEALSAQILKKLFGNGSEGSGGSGLGSTIASFLGSFFGGGRASGGPVSAGTTYMVGEDGPELFTPGVSGGITPNGAMGAGGGMNFNPTYNIDARGADETRIMTMLPPILQQHAQQVKYEVLHAFRRNGLPAPLRA